MNKAVKVFVSGGIAVLLMAATTESSEFQTPEEEVRTQQQIDWEQQQIDWHMEMFEKLVEDLKASGKTDAEDVLPENIDWHAYIQSGETNVDMKSRAMTSTVAIDNRIKTLVKEMRDQYDETAADLLDKHQKDWEKYAKSKTRLMADTYRDGSHYGLSAGYVIMEMQIERIKDLRRIHRYRTER